MYTVALRDEFRDDVRASVVPVILVEVPEGFLELAGLDEYHLQNLRRDGFRRPAVLVGTIGVLHGRVPCLNPLRETRCGSLIRRGHPRKISCLLGSERTMKLARPNVYAGLPHQKNTNPVLWFRLSQDFRTQSERS